MAEIRIPPGETKLLVADHDTTEYYATVEGSDVFLGRTESAARTTGRRAAAGDRGPLQSEEHEEVYAHNPSDSVTTATVHLDHNGFWFERQARAIVGAVQTSDNNEASPASDAYEHRYGTGVDVNASTVVEDLEAPDRADFIVISVDDAAGSFKVRVQFEDDDGNVVTERNPGNNGDLGGDSTRDVFGRVAVASPFVTVRVEDTSGASNTLDYSVYAR